MNFPIRSLLAAGVAGAALLALPAQAQSTDDIAVDLLQLMIDEGLLPAHKAQSLLDRARARAQEREDRQAANATAIEVPYVPEVVREQLREEVKAEVIAQAKEERWITADPIPEWIDGVRVSGDFRLRRQQVYFGEDNFPGFPDLQAINDAGGILTADGAPLINSTNDFGRTLYRARLGVEAKVSDHVLVGIRLGAGEDRGAISTNEVLGDLFQKDGIWIDRAYVTLKPHEAVQITGGRMANPFYSTDLVWDEDINPEGVAAQVRVPIGNGAVFANAGAFPLQQRHTNTVSLDRWMWAAQLGSEGRFGDFSIKAAAAYYDYRNIQSRKNALDSRLNDYTALAIVGSGNSKFNVRNDGGLTQLIGLSPDFNILNATASVAYTPTEDFEVRLTGDVARNLAFDANEILALEPNTTKPGDLAWHARIDVGDPLIEGFGDWRFGFAYKRLETDAVLDIFTDSDFGLGGTDLKGYVIDGEVGIYRNTSLGIRWLSANAIERRAIAPLWAVDSLLLDLNTRF